MERSSGILLHISSLPAPYGIGTLGLEAYRFADFLKRTGQRWWQILPIGPTGMGDSPYQSFSTFAGNPYFIDLDLLQKDGLLQKSEYESLDWGNNPESVDFGRVYENRFSVLKKAAARVTFGSSFSDFAEANAAWLNDYAAYMAIKSSQGMRPWTLWNDTALKHYDEKAVKQFCGQHPEEVLFWKCLQYLFFSQWNALKGYVNSLGIGIIGDIPIYVAQDSADVWAHRDMFLFDKTGEPTFVSGCPPDPFSATGQIWGNPLYDWAHMKKDGYGWWLDRLVYMSGVVDALRIDHFRGFESFYVIDQKERDARNGRWVQGPGAGFLKEVRYALGDFPIIAEDLGYITREVYELRAASGYPGMKLLQFAFDSREPYNYYPHTYERDNVAYTGTHDNNTLAGWFNDLPEQDLSQAVRYANLSREEGYVWGILRLMYSSVADVAVAQMQDLLELPAWARMNTPSTTGQNWRWRMKDGYENEALEQRLRETVALYERQAD